MTPTTTASTPSVSELEVRIVRLPAMRVASAHVPVSDTPEDDAVRILRAWALANGLLDRPGARWFGFNNPNPKDGGPAHGYEVWLTLPTEFDASTATPADGSRPVTIKEFGGGPYAVTGCTLETMSPAWSGLWRWVDDRHLGMGEHQWLEEVLNFRQSPDQAPIFDLHLPIAAVPAQPAGATQPA